MKATTTLDARAASIMDDTRALARAREGDEVAISELITRHRGRLLRIANNVLHDRFESEDVVQDAFLKAFRELRRLRDDRAFGGFLYRICVRLCLDRLRQRRAEPAEFDRAVRSPANAVETKVVVSELLERLSPTLKMTLVLREMEQLSYEEVAAAMDVPVGTVRSRLHAARERFRQLYEEATR